MGISNSIGSNTFDILLCLGLPWLIKASLTPAEPGNYWVRYPLYKCYILLKANLPSEILSDFTPSDLGPLFKYV